MTWRRSTQWMIESGVFSTPPPLFFLNRFAQPEVPQDLVFNYYTAQRFSG